MLGSPDGEPDAKGCVGLAVPAAQRLPPSLAVVSDFEGGDSRERRAPLQCQERRAASLRAPDTRASQKEATEQL